MDSIKVYVEVIAEITAEGVLTPRRVRWEDGRLFDIDKVLEIKPGVARRAGGNGDRFTVEIGGKRTYLFLERLLGAPPGSAGRFFVERRTMKA